jgi:hypothetical protein
VGHVACKAERNVSYDQKNLKGRDYLEDIEVDVKIILT